MRDLNDSISETQFNSILIALTIHFNLSLLMWTSMIVSVVLTLTLLPNILKKIKEQKKYLVNFYNIVIKKTGFYTLF